jgi:hypothetical protein
LSSSIYLVEGKVKSRDNIKTYRISEGEITLVEEVTGQFLIKILTNHKLKLKMLMMRK